MVTFDEEWAQLRAAAQRGDSGDSGDSGGEAGPDHAGGSWYADLAIDTERLRGLSDLVTPLREGLETALGGLRDDPDWSDDGLSALDVTRALRRIRTSWEGRLTHLREELSLMEAGFGGAAAGFDGTEEEIRTSLGAAEAGGDRP